MGEFFIEDMKMKIMVSWLIVLCGEIEIDVF